MRYFDQFVSNTSAACGNQSYFSLAEGEIHTGRVFLRLNAGGCYDYSLLFSNIIDSTYANGAHSHKNLICDSWEILSARAGICRDVQPDLPLSETLRFNGMTTKTVSPGEFFTSDPLPLSASRGDYLCLELTVRGRMIPYHEESVLPIFLAQEDGWKPGKTLPIPGMTGCRRSVTRRIGFIGDSITQGCGTPINSYAHYAARLAESLSDTYAIWDLGLGFGRAEDAASDSAWLFKAKQNDLVAVCFGVNDLLHGFSAQQLIQNLRTIVHKLRDAGVEVLLQTIPPFDYAPREAAVWREVNDAIRTGQVDEACETFDVVPILGQEAPLDHMARYGGHPNEEGHARWAEALLPVLTRMLRS